MNSNTREYKINEVITFARTQGKFGGLSNMAPSFPLFINEINIQSTEVLYQACRYSLFPQIQEEIIRTQNPMDAKKISRKYIEYTRQDWDFVKFKIMKWCLEVKLIQNFDKFSTIILNTDSKSIVEYSTKDDIWGAKPINADTLQGVNALGRLLMELREKLKSENITNNSVIYPPDINGFLLFDHAISETHNDQYFIGDIDDIYAY